MALVCSSRLCARFACLRVARKSLRSWHCGEQDYTERPYTHHTTLDHAVGARRARLLWKTQRRVQRSEYARVKIIRAPRETDDCVMRPVKSLRSARQVGLRALSGSSNSGPVAVCGAGLAGCVAARLLADQVGACQHIVCNSLLN